MKLEDVPIRVGNYKRRKSLIINKLSVLDIFIN